MPGIAATVRYFLGAALNPPEPMRARRAALDSVLGFAAGAWLAFWAGADASGKASGADALAGFLSGFMRVRPFC